MLNKKYFLISEIAQILGIETYRLRYLEKSLPSLGSKKIRGRRYYSKKDIEFLQKHYKIAKLNDLDNNSAQERVEIELESRNDNALEDYALPEISPVENNSIDDDVPITITFTEDDIFDGNKSTNDVNKEILIEQIELLKQKFSSLLIQKPVVKG